MANLYRQVLMELLLEDVTSASPTVYHRTDSLDKIKSILKSGFKLSSRVYHGEGVYSFQDMNSAINAPNVGVYGDYIIECDLPDIKSYLILNEDVAKIILKVNYSIKDQLESKGVLLSNYPKLESIIQEVSKSNSDNTSNISYIVSKYPDVQGKFSGKMYSRSKDYKAVLTFNPKSITPIRYKSVSEKDWHPITDIK